MRTPPVTTHNTRAFCMQSGSITASVFPEQQSVCRNASLSRQRNTLSFYRTVVTLCTIALPLATFTFCPKKVFWGFLIFRTKKYAFPTACPCNGEFHVLWRVNRTCERYVTYSKLTLQRAQQNTVSYFIFSFLWRNSPTGAQGASFFKFLYHMQLDTHTRQDTSERISRSQRPLPTRCTTHTGGDLHAPTGFRSRNHRNAAAPHLRLRPHGHRQ